MKDNFYCYIAICSEECNECPDGSEELEDCRFCPLYGNCRYCLQCNFKACNNCIYNKRTGD